mgnify:FL=1
MTRKRFVKVCREAGYSEEWIGALIDMAHKRYKSYQKTFDAFSGALADSQKIIKNIPVEDSAGFEADWPWYDDDQMEVYI